MIQYCKSIVIVVILLILGCKTPGIIIEDSNYSIKQHRIAVATAFGQVRNISENGRVMLSYFHDKDFKNFEANPKAGERRYTKVTILGSRRPYRLSIEVHIEQKDSATNKDLDVGLDEDLGQKIALKISEALNKGRADGSLFDEELPF